jgi:hypothetical protein
MNSFKAAGGLAVALVLTTPNVFARIDGCWELAGVEFLRASGKVEARSDFRCIALYQGTERVEKCGDARDTLTVYSIEAKGAESYIQRQTLRIINGKSAALAPPIEVLIRPQAGRLLLEISPTGPGSSDPVKKSTQDWKNASLSSCDSLKQYATGGHNPIANSSSNSGTQAQSRPLQVATPAPKIPSNGDRQPTAKVNLSGAYGAPDLLGFRIGADMAASLSNMQAMSNEGYRVMNIARVAEESGSNSGSIAFKGLRGLGKPESFVAVLNTSGSPVRIVVRGERFANPPFRQDFAAAIQEKFKAPDWALDGILRSNAPERPIWAVANGRPVKLTDCYPAMAGDTPQKGFVQQSAGGQDFLEVRWPSVGEYKLRTLKPNLCQYAVLVEFNTNIVATDGKLVGELVVSYSVALLDLEQSSADARAKAAGAASKEATERDAIRSNSSKPKL